jgi:hypothetical protein
MRLYKIYVQGVCGIRVVPDKSLIEVSEAKEDLDIPIGLRLRLFLNSFYIGKVYYNTPRSNNKA